MLNNFFKGLIRKRKFNSLHYWESRYAVGGNSGDGSYGRLAIFKADFINNFLVKSQVGSAIELGCGDGHQVSLIKYNSYIGFDVSATIIDKCKHRFAGDSSKKFFLYKPENFVPGNEFKAELAISLDVLYHIVEENHYRKYLDDLFSLSYKYVIIYSTNFSEREAEHVFHREFVKDISSLYKNWELIEYCANPFQGKGEQESLADFYVYQRIL